MNYSTQHISRQLKQARETKGLSQRELGARSGVPQSHISKIENGSVDLRLSSLVAIARALGLELALIPHAHLAAVKSIVGSAENRIDTPAYNLDGEG